MKYGGFFKTLTLLVTVLLAGSCNQDPIFYKISQETKPLEPRIKGTPTNMAVFEWADPADSSKTVPVLFVASGRLHWYGRPVPGAGPRWDSGGFDIPQPGGNVFGLAATKDYLYVLCFTGSGLSAEVKRIGRNEQEWKTVGFDSGALSHGYHQTIYADSETVFLGSRGGSTAPGSYAILYLTGTGSTQFKSLKTGVELLKGAASDGANYYLATEGSGIWKVEKNALPSDSPIVTRLGDSGYIFKGIINISDTNSTAGIIAVRNDGTLFSVNGTGTGLNSGADFDPYSTGALALWRDPEDSPEPEDPSPAPKLLLAGVQGAKTMTTSSGYTHGYTEIEINTTSGAIVSGSGFHNPGNGSPTSIVNNERYTASLGKYPINFLFQAPKEIDDKMTLFASTQTHGLWSYRTRDGEPQWNAEE
ncbi:MAG: hypothetical protein LBJ90_06205 [Treponema sp.]|jgi:hypothetical protein|nr:hypothetical protein [Treponema sp.]